MIKKVLEMMDFVTITDEDCVIFSEKSKKMIHEIAADCRKKELFRRYESRGESYGKGMTAEELYTDMLIKIAKAPTNVHMFGSVILLLPLVDNKLNGLSS